MLPRSQDNRNISSDNCTPNNCKSDNYADVVIILDRNKLPEELRDKFPQDLQDKLLELFQEKHDQHEVPQKQSTLFAVQQGHVIGNIYKDDI